VLNQKFTNLNKQYIHLSAMASPSSSTTPSSTTTIAEVNTQLTPEQAKVAFKHLAAKDYVTKFPRILHVNYDDKEVRNQKYGLFTFTPAPDVQPDKNGLYGIIRLRGNFSTIEKADDHANYLITKVSSYDEILYAMIGRDCPVAADSTKFCQELKEIDVQKEMEKVTVQNLRKKIELEKKEAGDVLERKKKMDEMNQLVEKINKAGGVQKLEINLERYTELRVKNANLRIRKTELIQKLAECAVSLSKTRKEILSANEESKLEFVDKFMNNYIDALKKIGAPIDANPTVLQLRRDLKDDPELDGKMILEQPKEDSVKLEVTPVKSEVTPSSTTEPKLEVVQRSEEVAK